MAGPSNPCGWQRGTALICMTALVIGCAGSGHQRMTPIQGPEPIHISASGEPAVTRFHGFAIGTGSGLARGAASGILSGLGEVRAAGDFAGLAFLLATAIGATVGAITGARTAVPPEQADAAIAALDARVADMALSTRLAERVVTLAPAHAGLDAGQLRLDDRGATVPPAARRVEVAVTALGFEDGMGADPAVRLSLSARVRVVGTAPGIEADREQDSGAFRYVSPARPLSFWLQDDGRNLIAAIEDALGRVALDVIDELFLVTAFPFDSGLWTFPGRQGYGFCWFEPLEPVQRHRTFTGSLADASPDTMLRWDYVPANPPTLRWEAFPRPRDARDAHTLARIGDVSYDLLVWAAPDGVRRELVYAARNLPAPEHRLLHPLPHHARFFWTFRARYRLDGAPRVTPWAFSAIPATGVGMPAGGSCEPVFIPDSNYFRFRTR